MNLLCLTLDELGREVDELPKQIKPWVKARIKADKAPLKTTRGIEEPEVLKQLMLRTENRLEVPQVDS